MESGPGASAEGTAPIGCCPARVAGRSRADSAAFVESHEHRRHALDAHLRDIVHGLEGDELNRRVWAIADVGSRRQEYLKANDMFTPAPPADRTGGYPWHDDRGLDDR